MPPKNSNNKDLKALRHSAEHVLMQAMEQLYPTKIIKAMGPATDTGFYFDFDTVGDFKITEDNFDAIEKQMRKIIKQDLAFTNKTIAADQARQLFKNNPYKQEWIKEAQERGEDLTIYYSGDAKDKNAFVDLCSGPHLDSTGQIPAFKLLSVAGAYWRGDEKNKMLTRIYGTAFESPAKIDDYLLNLEEAKKRDHKKLGKELDLFTFSDLVGSGLPLWTPKGTILRQVLDDFVWSLRKKYGYQKVEIPHISKKDLYVTSGHWDKFAQELFHIKTREGHQFAIKPMNCPHHTQIYARRPHSYRELPQRYANTTMVYRDEQSGELSGLSRVRCLTQDDAHVFCRKSQVEEEMNKIWDIVEEFYKPVGFDLQVRLSLHDPANQKAYLGSSQNWSEAENNLRQLSQKRGIKIVEAPGEAAFYGPKIDFMAQDSLKRQWQVATIQLDMNMPERFNLNCTNEKGQEERIYMLHAAIMGSIERYLSILIEHFAGAFPLWLSPVQVSLLPISEKFIDYTNQVKSNLEAQNIRVELDSSDESLGKKIRRASAQKVPYMAIIGQKELSSKQLSVRQRGEKDLGSMTFEQFFGKISLEIDQKVIL